MCIWGCRSSPGFRDSRIRCKYYFQAGRSLRCRCPKSAGEMRGLRASDQRRTGSLLGANRFSVTYGSYKETGQSRGLGNSVCTSVGDLCCRLWASRPSRFGIRIIAWTIKNWIDFKGVLGIFLFLFCRFPSLHLAQKAVFLAIMCLFSPVEWTSPRTRLLHCLRIL